MMYLLTEQAHAQIVDALENVSGKGKRCDAALSMLKAMKPAAQAAQPAQIPEPFGYVVEHNVPPTSTYKWSFHPAAQGLSFYADTALVITPVYIAAPSTKEQAE